MILTYAKRNLDNIAKLGPKTQVAALKWHDFLTKNNIDVLIYETARTEEQQRKNLANGVSQTMHSYHLVGQALDFVPVKNKESDWDGYNTPAIKKAIAEAVRLGFTWGADWDRDGQTADEHFIDRPHLQFDRIPYGKDIGKTVPTAINTTPLVRRGATGNEVKQLQQQLNKLGFGLKVDGDFGQATDLAVKTLQKRHGLSPDGIVGKLTKDALALDIKGKAEAQKIVDEHKTPGIHVMGTLEITNLTGFTYIYAAPDDKSSHLGDAYKGKRFPVAGSVPGWWEIVYNNRRAYIKNKYGKLV